MEQKQRRILYTVLSVVLLIVVFLIVFRLLGTNSVEITEWEFRENISTFDKVYLNYYRVECVKGNQSYYFITADREALNQFILDSIRDGNLTLQYTSADPNATSWTDYIIPALWLGIIIALGVFMFRMIARQNNQNMDFGRSRAKAVHNMKVRFPTLPAPMRKRKSCKR